MTSTKNNYAFEIRFVDDNIVQVFDIAAKRQKEGTGLPVEYKQDEVLKGQLRYSKLVGGAPSTDTDDDEYQHQVTTKRSKNRRSIQRQTFFMMGSGGGEDEYIDKTISNNSREDHHSPVTQTVSISPLQQQELIVSTTKHLSLSPSPESPTPAQGSGSPLYNASPNLSPQTQQSSLHSYSPPTSPVPFSPIPLSPISRTSSVQTPPAVKHSLSMSQRKRTREESMSTTQIAPSLPQQYYSEDYTSMTMIDTHDDSSKRNFQQVKEATSGCCIIS